MRNLAIKVIFICTIIWASCKNSKQPEIEISYLGHSSFLIKFSDEASVITDYGSLNAWIQYGWDSPVFSKGNHNPDIATYSHQHEDHFDISRIDTTKTIIYFGADVLQYNKLKIKSIPTSEKDIKIADNKSYLFEYMGIKILHMGDSQASIRAIANPQNRKYLLEQLPPDIDILLFPIQGTNKFIPEAIEFINMVKANINIPMHYWSIEYKKEFLEACTKINNLKVHRREGNLFNYSTIAIDESMLIIDMQSGRYSSGQ